MHSTISRALAALALVFAATSTCAQSAVRIIVPYAPGGTTDIAARILGQAASQQLSRPLVIENRAGGSGAIGLAALGASPADGSTVGIASHASLRSMIAAGQTPPRLEVVSGLALSDFVVVAAPGAAGDLRSARGALAHLSGVGQACAEELARKNPGLTAVEYRGVAPALADVASNTAQFACVPLGVAMASITPGRVRALATTGPERSKLLPGVPTLDELGISNAMLFDWMVVVAPAGTPPAAKAELTKAFASAIAQASSKFSEMGMQPFDPSEAAQADRLQGFVDRRMAEMRR